jgi:DNA polymerase-3 subunit epsilon
MYLFFDTETTGLIDFKKDLLDPSQPRIIQLGAILTDATGATIAELNAFIKPDGWTIDEQGKAFEANGITQIKCETVGIPMSHALAIFNAMKAACKCRVAHNISFDKQMLAREAGAYGIPHDSEGIESFCTMQSSKGILKLPPSDKMMAAGIKAFKTPNLQEAHVHFMGCEFEGAHDAMADVRACTDVFFAMKKLKQQEAA